MPAAARSRYLDEAVKGIVAHAYQNAPAIREKMDRAGVGPADIRGTADLVKIPITHKSELLEREHAALPFGGFLAVPRTAQIYISPGLTYEPEIPDPQVCSDAKALYAAGFRRGDVTLVTISFHMVPAGANHALALERIGATVVPSGVGNTELQLQIIQDLKITGYLGTPSFLMSMIERAESLGVDFPIRSAIVGGEMFPESLRLTFKEKYGITALQTYGTAELLNVAYECNRVAGWHVAEESHVEIVDPATGQPVQPGEVGEIVVTPFNPVFPLVRYGTGDLSSLTVTPCACGRTSPRLNGLLGRVGDAVKVRGMFLHPRQVSEVVARFPNVARCQVVVDRISERDHVTLQLELIQDADGESVQAALPKLFQELCRVKVDRLDMVDPSLILQDAKLILDHRVWG